MKETKLKLTCPECGKQLKHGERGGYYCPNCGQMVDPKDADHIDPKLAREAGMTK